MKFYENYYFYSFTWKFTPCKITFYIKIMTASCSMSSAYSHNFQTNSIFSLTGNDEIYSIST